MALENAAGGRGMEGRSGPVSSVEIPGYGDLVVHQDDRLGRLIEGTEIPSGRRILLRILEPTLDAGQRESLVSLGSRYPALPNLLTVSVSGVASSGSFFVGAELYLPGVVETTAPGASTISEDAALGLLAELLPTMREMHLRGATHGAISPSALLRVGGRWALADAGIAEIAVPLPPPPTAEMDELLPYVAPEVLAGRPCTPAGDVFGLALTLVTLCAGWRASHRAGQTVSEYVTGRQATNAPMTAMLPPRLAAILSSALDWLPETRPTVAELLQRLPTSSIVDAKPSSRAVNMELENVLDKDVQFTVYRPSVVAVGLWETLIAAAHKSEPYEDVGGRKVDPVAEVKGLAEQRLGDLSGYQQSVSDSSQELLRGSELTFVPEVSSVEFNPSQASFLWQEPIHLVEFRFRVVDPSVVGQHLRGRVSVFYGLLLIAEVSVTLQVVAGNARMTVRSAPERAVARPYQSIFASYSHQDASIVDWFEQAIRASGIEYLRDVRSLRSGETWDNRLQELIHESDIFQLFWSSNARSSEFVRREWTYALGLQREQFVRPLFWERPMPEAPPELEPIHFTFFGLSSGWQLGGGAVPRPEYVAERRDTGSAAEPAYEAPPPTPRQAPDPYLPPPSPAQYPPPPSPAPTIPSPPSYQADAPHRSGRVGLWPVLLLLAIGLTVGIALLGIAALSVTAR